MTAFGWAVVTACIWGCVPILEKMGLARISPMGGLFYRSIGVAVGAVLLGLFVVKPPEVKAVDWKSAALVMVGGFLASVVGQMCFYRSLKVGEVSKMVLISGSYPFISFVLGVLVLGESVTPLKIAGVALIGAGLLVLKLG